MTTPENADPPPVHHEPTFDELLEKADSEYKAYKNEITKPTERLYASLEAAYKLEILGESKPEEYESFIEREFTTRKLGYITKGTPPFMRAIRLIIDNEQSRSPDRTRYSLALAAVKSQIGNEGAEAKVADFIKNYPRKIDGLVEKARIEKAEKANEEREKISADKKGEEIVLKRKPKGKIVRYAKPQPGEEGFRLVLCNLKANGSLDVYDENTESGTDALFRKIYSLQEKSRPKPVYIGHVLKSLVQTSTIFRKASPFEMVLINRGGHCYADISKLNDNKTYPMIKVFASSAIEGVSEDEVVSLDAADVVILRCTLKSEKLWKYNEITVTKKGDFDFQVRKFCEAMLSLRVEKYKKYEQESFNVLNDVLDAHLLKPITPNNIGDQNIPKNLLSAIQSKYTFDFQVGELCGYMLSKRLAGNKEALIQSINALLSKELDPALTTQTLPPFAKPALTKAIAKKYHNKSNKVENFLKALSSQMKNNYPLKEYTIKEYPSYKEQWKEFLNDIQNPKRGLSGDNPLKAYESPENRIIFSNSVLSSPHFAIQF